MVANFLLFSSHFRCSTFRTSGARFHSAAGPCLSSLQDLVQNRSEKLQPNSVAAIFRFEFWRHFWRFLSTWPSAGTIFEQPWRTRGPDPTPKSLPSLLRSRPGRCPSCTGCSETIRRTFPEWRPSDRNSADPCWWFVGIVWVGLDRGSKASWLRPGTRSVPDEPRGRRAGPKILLCTCWNDSIFYIITVQLNAYVEMIAFFTLSQYNSMHLLKWQLFTFSQYNKNLTFQLHNKIYQLSILTGIYVRSNESFG